MVFLLDGATSRHRISRPRDPPSPTHPATGIRLQVAE
jgi:hypothetical protein